MPTELERRARELLKSAIADVGLSFNGEEGSLFYDAGHEAAALRAIAAALQAQQPGAQAVAEVCRNAWGNLYLHWLSSIQDAGLGAKFYTHPQPLTSNVLREIPEPSEADVEAAESERTRSINAISAYGSAGVDERYDMAMRAALTTYTARLRESLK
jgi:hypothetical protein